MKAKLLKWVCTSLVALTSGVPLVHAQELEARIGYYPGIVIHLPLFVAETKGFFKAAGVKPSLVTIANGPAMNSQLASGSIDFGFQPPSNLGVAREQGLDQVFVVGNVTMPWVLMARKDLSVPNGGKYPAVMADLKGLKWGVYGRGADGEVFMRVMAEDAGLDPQKDVTWIAVGGPNTGLPALKAEQIDVYLTTEPAPTIVTTLGYGKVILDLRKGEGPANFNGISYNGLVALRKKVTDNPQLAKAVADATVRAQCWLRKPENFQEALAIAKARIGAGDLSEKDFTAMVRESIPTFKASMATQHFKSWNDILLRAKVIKQPMSAEQVRWSTVPESEPVCQG